MAETNVAVNVAVLFDFTLQKPVSAAHWGNTGTCACMVELAGASP